MEISELEKSELIEIGGKVLSEEGQRALDELLKKGEIFSARMYVLAGIRSSWDCEKITFDDAVSFHARLRMLPVPPLGYIPNRTLH